MVYYRSARFWKLQLPSSKSRRERYHFLKLSKKPFAKNEELNRLLINIFAKFYLEDESSFYKSVVGFLTFEYSTEEPILAISLSLKGVVHFVREISKEKDIIQIFKALLRKKIPHLISSLLERIKLKLHYDACLSVIAVTSGKSTTSVFCVLNRQKGSLKERPSPKDRGCQGLEPRDAHPSPVTPASDRPLYTLLDPSIATANKNANESKRGPQEKKMEQDPLPEIVKLRKFIEMQEAANRVFIFDRVVKDKHILMVCAVITEEEMSTLCVMDNCIDVHKILKSLKRVRRCEISHLKFLECPVEDREKMDKCVLSLFEAVLHSATYMQVKYMSLSSEDFDVKNVMELDVIPPPPEINGGSKDKIHKIGFVELGWKDVLTLTGSAWLNDNVIDSYLNLIAIRARVHPESLPSVHVENSFFMMRLVQNKRPRRSQLPPLLKCDLVFVPRNIGDKHWTLFCINNKTNKITYYDSLGGAMRTEDKNALEALMNDLSQQFPRLARCPSRYKCFQGEAVKQTTMFDCGLYVLMHAEFLSRNEKFRFSQENMPHIRKRVIDELLAQKISPVNYEVTSTAPRVDSRKNESLVEREAVAYFIRKENTCIVVIEAYLTLIARRSRSCCDVLPSVRVFDTLFMASLLSGSAQPSEHKDALECDLLFMPLVFVPERTCVLFCIDHRKGSILCYNFLDDFDYLGVLQLIEEFLETVKGSALGYHKGLGPAVKTSEQSDTDVFLLMQAEYLSRDKALTLTVFEEEQTSYYRNLIGIGILRQTLTSPLPDVPPPGFQTLPLPSDLVIYPSEGIGTLAMGMYLAESVILSYLILLKKEYGIWVHPNDQSSTTDQIERFFVFKNMKGWSLVAVQPLESRVIYYNIPPKKCILEELQGIETVSKYVDLTQYKPMQLPFSELAVDSGVYVLSSIYCFAGGHYPTFDGSSVGYLRRKIYLELLCNTLMKKHEVNE